MRLKNHTDIPTETVREIIRAVRPAGISNFDVRVSNSKSRGGAGRAYHSGSGYHDTAAPFIVVRVPDTEAKARCIRHGGNGYLPMTTGSRMEVLVMILAHELRHMWQAKHTRGKVYGAKGRFSERDADAYALQMLRRFRRGELLRAPEARNAGQATTGRPDDHDRPETFGKPDHETVGAAGQEIP